MYNLWRHSNYRHASTLLWKILECRDENAMWRQLIKFLWNYRWIVERLGLFSTHDWRSFWEMIELQQGISCWDSPRRRGCIKTLLEGQIQDLKTIAEVLIFFCFMPKNPRLRFKSMNVWRDTYSQRKVNEFDSHRSHVQNAHVLI